MISILQRLSKDKDQTNAEKCIAGLGPLYHHYRFFGIDNQQLSDTFVQNQQAKEPILLAYISLAIAKCQQTSISPPSFTELFCADGYYAMLARKLGCEPCYGLDSGKDPFFRAAPKISRCLGLDGVRFIRSDVNHLNRYPRTDIVANIGGLYHITNAEAVLDLSYQHSIRFLIVQTVVSLASHSRHYYVTPAPGWHWGCRYSRQSFSALIKAKGYRVIDEHFNELTGNERPEDRGSVYYLIQKDR